jgi:adenine C2-methylase RlmN of 23S rRNA A2503 and tRNA A37
MKVNEIIQMIEIMKKDAKGILLPWVLSFSGHGEPMLNWNVVIEVINYFNGQFSKNYITSVGIVPVLEDILEEK